MSVLTPTGVAKARQVLNEMESGALRDAELVRKALQMLSDPALAKRSPRHVEIDADVVFQRRFDLAKYLAERVPEAGLLDPSREVGLWTWLALLWIDQLAPAVNGVRKLGERARWIPEGGWKYYRHLVLGPYLIYQSNGDQPERAMALLHNPPHTPGELVGQLAATQRVAQSKAAVGAATRLYYCARTQTLKRGAGGSARGSSRRLRTVLDQFDRTFDLQSLSVDALLELLPREFDRYRR